MKRIVVLSIFSFVFSVCFAQKLTIENKMGVKFDSIVIVKERTDKIDKDNIDNYMIKNVEEIFSIVDVNDDVFKSYRKTVKYAKEIDCGGGDGLYSLYFINKQTNKCCVVYGVNTVTTKEITISEKTCIGIQACESIFFGGLVELHFIFLNKSDYTIYQIYKSADSSYEDNIIRNVNKKIMPGEGREFSIVDEDEYYGFVDVGNGIAEIKIKDNAPKYITLKLYSVDEKSNLIKFVIPNINRDDTYVTITNDYIVKE